MAAPLRIALVAGEASGDLLGAAFIEAVRALHPQAQFVGIAGPRMQAAGCRAIAQSEELAVMGLAEILRHLPRLLRLRRRVRRALFDERPDVFVGIDAPEFNLRLAGQLKAAGIPTVQYVSPQVWAWRQGRVRHMSRAVDLVLCLLPFEARFYAEHAVQARFVGHPLADQIPIEVDRRAARRQLDLPDEQTIVALLPGSRMGEVTRLGADFAAAAALLQARRPGAVLQFIAPMATPRVREVFAAQVAAAGAPVRLLDGQAREALIAADVVLVASGTATLETMLCKRPMVAAYKVAPLTAWIVRGLGLVKVPFFSHPNLLAGEALVPEFLQEGVTPEALAAAVGRQLDDVGARAHMQEVFAGIHRSLRQDGAHQAAEAVLGLLAARRGGATAP